jgi:uncharacterized protein involved in response to NO
LALALLPVNLGQASQAEGKKMIQLQTERKVGRFALFYLGFRPFFTAAVAFAVFGVSAWVLMYVYSINPPWFVSSVVYWHAHEMVYGYTLAVIAGFLLTAVKNWTGIQTLHRWPLAILVLLWLAARVLAFTASLDYLLIAEGLFVIGLLLAVAIPLLRARQWRQLLIILVLLGLAVGDGLYYAGVWYFQTQWQVWGIYTGLYFVLLLIFFMGRRVIPFFIERGVEPPVKLRNYRWLDYSSVGLFVLFAVTDILPGWGAVTAALAAGLFLLHGVRMVLWHTPGMWRKPLLWVLYVAYGWLTLGFLLKLVAAMSAVSPTLAVHAFAYGGIGMMTAGMMARVSLGHTGREVAAPPPILAWVFSILTVGCVVRVLFPLVDPANYRDWIGLSGAMWILAFLMYFVRFVPIWLRPRIDGQYG